MPYNLSTRIVKGKKKYCMTSKRTGKTYCYSSEADRKQGMRLHEYYGKQ